MTFSSIDGRYLTNYNSQCNIDSKIMKDNGIKSQEEYRIFLQKNGKAINTLVFNNIKTKIKNNEVTK